MGDPESIQRAEGNSVVVVLKSLSGFDILLEIVLVLPQDSILRWHATFNYVPLVVNVSVFAIGILHYSRFCQNIFHAFFVYL